MPAIDPDIILMLFSLLGAGAIAGITTGLFGVGGGDLVAEQLSSVLGTEVPVLGRIPFDPRLREGGDKGEPLVLAQPDAPASMALAAIADSLASKPRGLAGMQLGISPTGRG